ncbi:MAG: bifunctional folylpolyglutamate synthase/dihydrofolate synthase, partial [Lachnospiraceae bacterium]|nr:bifunctional folylpolyglutamate synthase/dihydrofolate synthase [Lachnospiraceae bacterium]
MTYKEARVYLDNLSKYGSVLGLGTIQKLLCELGNPQDDLKFIHIAGTNGKGSVLAYTSTILSKAGCKVGRYVSPTVISYLERIQVDGMWISEDAFARLTARVREAIARMESAGEKSPTVFEIETAIAFLYFKEQDCDLVVLECGLGGETDATNIVENTLVAVFTPISRDHTGILGDTPGEIAAVKAGIIKPGCIVVTSAQEPEVMQVLRDRAGQLDCPLHVTRQEQLEILDDRYLGQIISYKG